MQTVPWIFGIPHPTGFPAYVLFAGAFAHAFAAGSVAWRTALFCGLSMLGTVATVYCATVRITGDRATGACAAALLAFGGFFWIDGDRAEVHALAALFAALALYWSLRGFYDRDPRAFFGAALALGLGTATHPIAIFAIPSVLVLAFARRRCFALRDVCVALLLAIAPLALYAYLPLRSRQIVAQGLDPAPAIGKPPGAAIWNTDDPASAAGFVRLVTGSDFHAARSVLRIADLPYYGDKLGIFARAMYLEFTPVGAAAAFLGLGILFRRRPVVAFALLLAVLLPAAFALAYPPVIEIERYFFIPMIAVALAIALGVTALEGHYRNLLRIPIAGAAVFLLVANYPNAAFHAQTGSEGLITAVHRATAAHAIVVADWTLGTALAYDKYVDGGLRGRTLDIAWPFQDRRYFAQWLRERPVYYVGAPILRTHRVLLCRVTRLYPIYAVHTEPGHC